MSSLGFGVIRSLVIFLYLLDNDTSALILFGVGKDSVWSAWKLFKVLRSRQKSRDDAANSTELEPAASMTQIESRVKAGGGPVKSLSEDELHHFTAWCDHYATLHVGLCVYPMVVGMALYSMQHNAYASWWSWLISSAADSVYLFGFVSMCPQLYVNYKLQSVAHMPSQPWDTRYLTLLSTTSSPSWEDAAQAPHHDPQGRRHLPGLPIPVVGL